MAFGSPPGPLLSPLEISLRRYDPIGSLATGGTFPILDNRYQQRGEFVMRRSQVCVIRVLFALASMAAVSVVASVMATPAAAANSSSFADPIGDPSYKPARGVAPDIGEVRVSNDDAGNLAFAIQIANGPLIGTIGVHMDTDRNTATGWNGGNEAELWVDTRLNPDHGATRWEAGGLNSIPSQEWYDATTGWLHFTLNARDLGSPSGFDFSISSAFDDGTGSLDSAPNYGAWSYQVLLAPPPPPPDPPAPPASPPPPPPPTAPTAPPPATSPPAPTAPTAPTAPPASPPTPAPPPAGVACIVPKVVGRTLASARIRIFSANCTLGRVSKARSSKRKGTVIAQGPHAGTARAEGGRVNVIVSRGPR
jgi:PASTA domain